MVDLVAKSGQIPQNKGKSVAIILLNDQYLHSNYFYCAHNHSMGSESCVRVHACRLIITLSFCVIVQCLISSKREANKNPACPVEAIIIITTWYYA